MNIEQKQLQSVLQALALPVTGQLRLYPNEDCKVSRLIQEYEAFEPLFLDEWHHYLTVDQEAALALLRRDLMIVCVGAGGANHTCADVVLRRSVAWRRVRLLARNALLALNWPFVAIPQFEPVLM